MSVPGLKGSVFGIISDDAPPRNESWRFEVGTPGEYLRGKRTPSQQVCVIAYSLLFSGVASGTAAEAWDFRPQAPIYAPGRPHSITRIDF